jgi:hypothetical protein
MDGTNFVDYIKDSDKGEYDRQLFTPGLLLLLPSSGI